MVISINGVRYTQAELTVKKYSYFWILDEALRIVRSKGGTGICIDSAPSDRYALYTLSEANDYINSIVDDTIA